MRNHGGTERSVQANNPPYSTVITIGLYLNEFNIIKTQGQLFRIYKRVKSMAGDSVTVYARHIWYDLLANFVEDARPTLMNGQGAIDWILKAKRTKNIIL